MARAHPPVGSRSLSPDSNAATLDAAAPGDVTRGLQDWSLGRPAAEERLLSLIYDSLRALARQCLRRERRGHTLQTTELVHEAYLRLVAQSRFTWQSRRHFFAIAARAVRRVLLDHARRGLAGKRIAPEDRVAIEDAPEPSTSRLRGDAADLIDLDEALNRLSEIDSRQARLVELRFFGGLTIRETAERLEISPATVKREWRLAQAWLRREMRAENRACRLEESTGR